MTIRENERSAVIELISEINIFVSALDISIKRAGGESTLKGNANSMFPDIMLFGDLGRTQVLQGWEAKMPDVSITDITLIKNARLKATLLGVDSFVLWNFKSARLYSANNGGDFEIIGSWENPDINTRSDVELYQAEWKNTLKRIIIEINSYFANGTLNTTKIENFLTDNVGVALLERNKNAVSDYLKEKSITDTRISAFINNWWRLFHNDYKKDEADKYVAYAKTILLHWFNRIIFANLIKKYFNPALEVEHLNNEISPRQANEIFTRITEACDFYSIFSKYTYDEYLPDESWADICAINRFLIENSISNFPHECTQKILEKTISVGRREVRGQYTTPETLADILVQLTIRNLRDPFFDPCCGSGTIVRAARIYKRTALSAKDSVETVWAEDKDSYPLQIAQLALSDTENIAIPTKLFQKDIFDLAENEQINIVDPANGTLLQYKLPLFGAIASNLPFVAFENIEEDAIGKINELNNLVAPFGYKIDGRSDIYMPIILSLHKHLKPNGMLGVILSNSWLATKAGQNFFNILPIFYDVEQIHISGNGKWFANADIVTTILILKKKEIGVVLNDNAEISFYLWRKSINELAINSNFKQQLVFSALQNEETDSNIVSVHKYSFDIINQLLSYNLSKNALFHNIEWFLRMKNCLCAKKEIYHIFRGERRGWDALFYPAMESAIDREYIQSVLLTGKHIQSLTATPDGEAFCCHLSEDELQQKGKSNTLNWINKFKHEVNGVGKPLPQVLARSNMYWYEMSDVVTADIVTTMNPEKRIFYAALNEPVLINQRLIGLKYLDDTINRDLCHALLNSIFEMFIVEATGFGRGLGVLDINAQNIQQSFMLNPKLLNDEQTNKIITAFEPLKQRKIYDTEKELNQTDRINFDTTVLQCFGIEDLYNDIKNSLLSMQHSRLSVK